jgi:hypothetical protein
MAFRFLSKIAMFFAGYRYLFFRSRKHRLIINVFIAMFLPGARNEVFRGESFCHD